MFIERGKKKHKNIGNIRNAFTKEINAWLLLTPALLCIYFLVIRPQILSAYWSMFDMKG